MIRPITIKSVLNGFIVEVGCQTVVFGGEQAITELSLAMEHYFRNPEDAVKHWTTNSINAKHTNRPDVPYARDVLRHPYPDETAKSIYNTTGNAVRTEGGGQATR